ncbi:Stress responsive A/B Barrel Domain [Catalinimonas alkaloidigena]|uniref:Stress responsive A/B Barrel Domain n=1 Tax=Catalinimonas alkaloidigena TaxID=1075417 RepID=A0A1G9DIT5_9BACT|nr:Dabb family protein [Catalinimonas alkaloidigena]SDK63779.1 Stress responsive A/B Barrel Domain [Catalinimonas alkaloidigena]
MKALFTFVLLLTVTPLLLAMTPTDPPKEDQVRHIVIFKYKPGATEAQIKQVTDAFAALKGKVPGIVAFEHGVNNSPEGKNLGFTHVYQLTFKDAASRDAYLPHPDHKKFGELLGKLQVVEDVFVVDYATGK